MNNVEPKGPYLRSIDNKLCLGSDSFPDFKPICIDFLSKETEHRLKTGLNRKDLLIKSIGGIGERPLIIDLTAGLCGDAFHLASWGCEVIAIERNPIISQLAEDAFKRAKEHGGKIAEAIDRIKYNPNSDSLSIISNFADPKAVFYFDPMYPDLSKSALQKKEMQLLREVTGDDLDADDLFLKLFDLPHSRIVVKRPLQAPLLKENPRVQYKGKAVRFDVY